MYPPNWKQKTKCRWSMLKIIFCEKIGRVWFECKHLLLNHKTLLLILYNFSAWKFLRIIVVPTNAFDSKIKFLEKTRNAFGGGTFSLSEAVTSDIQNFYSFLKHQYNTEEPRAYYAVEVIGQQPSSYWCLSREVSHESQRKSYRSRPNFSRRTKSLKVYNLHIYTVN